MHRRVDGVALPMKGPAGAMLLFLIFLFLTIPLMTGEAMGEEEDSSEHDYHNNEWTFLIISFVMTYGAMAIVTSLFTFRFGQKKAKIISIPVLISGLVIWGIWIYFKFIMRVGYPDDTIFNIIHWSAAPILKPLLAVIGVILGAGLALFIFLTLVVRS
ncbi:MAG: hypothetical protein JW939_04535 [Candidatus Thermoplasmatota archaeon]|nr:hypothetical protein [Candidatus Thermoplasmatota archaeon]